MTFFDLQNSNVTWNHYADPSPTGSKGIKMGNYWPHGKVLGGSSAVNYMIYARGNKRDYDMWSHLGNPTWNWNNAIKYFKKSENNHSPTIATNTKYHSTDGPLNIETLPPIKDPKTILIRKGLESLGLKNIDDINADKYLGIVET